MALWIGTYPNIFPCGRNGERFDTPQYFRVAHWLSIRIAISEALATPDSLDAGLSVGNVPQPCFPCGLDRIGDECLHATESRHVLSHRPLLRCFTGGRNSSRSAAHVLVCCNF